MSSIETIDTIQAGLTGNVATKALEIMADPRNPLRLVAIATASHPELIDKTFGESPLEGPAIWDDVPIVSMEQALDIEAPVVLSGLRTEEAAHWEIPLAEARWEMSNSSPHRMEDYAALFNGHIGGGQLKELHGMSLPGRMVKGGNCVGIPVSNVADPIHRALGIVGMKIKTRQGWSGSGATEVPAGKERTFPRIKGDEQEKIETEPLKLLGGIQDYADIDIDARPRRGTWVYGHYAKFKMDVARPITKAELIELLDDVRSPEVLRDIDYGKNGPQERPLRLVKHRLLEPDEQYVRRLVRQPKPMRTDVHIRDVSEDGLTIRGELTSDNLVQGAAGANIMNIMYARALGYI